ATGNFDTLAYAYLYSRKPNGPWADLTLTDSATAANTAVNAGDEPVASAKGTTLRIPALADSLYIRRIAYSPERLCADTSDAVLLAVLRYRQPEVSIVMTQQACAENDAFRAKVDASNDLGDNPRYQWFLNGVPMDGETDDAISTAAIDNRDSIMLVAYPDYGGYRCPGPDSVRSNVLVIRKSDYMGAGLAASDTVCEQELAPVTATLDLGTNLNPRYTWFADGKQFAATSGADTIAYLTGKATKGKDSIRVYMRIDATSSCNGRAIRAFSDTITVHVNRVKGNAIAHDTAVCEQEPIDVTGSTATGNFDDLAYVYLYSRAAKGPWAELAVSDSATAVNTAVAPGDEPMAWLGGTTLHIPALADTLYIRRISYSPERLCADTTDAVRLLAVRYRHPALGIALSEERLCGNDKFGIKLADTNKYLSGNSTYTWYKRDVVDGSIATVGTTDSIGVADVLPGDQFWCVVTSTEGCVLPEERTAVSDTLKIVYRRNTGLKITGDTVFCAQEPVR
ncbi:MAG: hypothetical protein K2I68_03645, partial [Bacteroidales bacterium]|nr:hypothetical protein [Bacteroidales bacterium]